VRPARRRAGGVLPTTSITVSVHRARLLKHVATNHHICDEYRKHPRHHGHAQRQEQDGHVAQSQIAVKVRVRLLPDRGHRVQQAQTLREPHRVEESACFRLSIIFPRETHDRRDASIAALVLVHFPILEQRDGRVRLGAYAFQQQPILRPIDATDEELTLEFARHLPPHRRQRDAMFTPLRVHLDEHRRPSSHDFVKVRLAQIHHLTVRAVSIKPRLRHRRRVSARARPSRTEPEQTPRARQRHHRHRRHRPRSPRAVPPPRAIARASEAVSTSVAPRPRRARRHSAPSNASRARASATARANGGATTRERRHTDHTRRRVADRIRAK